MAKRKKKPLTVRELAAFLTEYEDQDAVVVINDRPDHFLAVISVKREYLMILDKEEAKRFGKAARPAVSLSWR